MPKFTFPASWTELLQDLPAEVLALLEERDRALEDYLASLKLTAPAPGTGDTTLVWRSTAQVVPHYTFTNLVVDTVYADPLGVWDPATPDRLTAQVAGLYSVSSVLQWEPNTTGNRRLQVIAHLGADQVTLSGTALRAPETPTSSTVWSALMSAQGIVAMSPGDYFRAPMIQSSGGGSLSVESIAANHFPNLSMTLLRRL